MATSILLLMDGGGSNSSRHSIFKQDLQALVDEIGIEIRIAHYPPYTSKWNPIEHRVFPHITRELSGMILTSHLFMKGLIEKTTTKAGLKVFACIFTAILIMDYLLKSISYNQIKTKACLLFNKSYAHRAGWHSEHRIYWVLTALCAIIPARVARMMV